MSVTTEISNEEFLVKLMDNMKQCTSNSEVLKHFENRYKREIEEGVFSRGTWRAEVVANLDWIMYLKDNEIE